MGKLHLISFLTALYLLCTGTTAKESNSELDGVLKFKTSWDGDYPHEYSANIFQYKSGIGRLEILENEKRLFSFKPGIFPESCFNLPDGNLATIWSHANGRKHLYVFSERNCKFTQVLDVTSMLPFEFVTDTEDESISKIIVAEVDWVNGERKPITAEIYRWKEYKQSYIREKTTWSKRLKNI